MPYSCSSAALHRNYIQTVADAWAKNNIQNYNDLEAIRFLDNVTIYEPEDINHILREVESENNIMNIKKEYKLLFKKPISKEINNSIKNWINNI